MGVKEQLSGCYQEKKEKSPEKKFEWTVANWIAAKNKQSNDDAKKRKSDWVENEDAAMKEKKPKLTNWTKDEWKVWNDKKRSVPKPQAQPPTPPAPPPAVHAKVEERPEWVRGMPSVASCPMADASKRSELKP